MAEQWTCSYCNHDCTVDGNDVRVIENSVLVSREYGSYHGRIVVIVCPNPKCRQRTISVRICEFYPDRGRIGNELFNWKLLPESEARPFPEYIPKQLRDDYTEACVIKDKSPKASATLSRRCLQGIIRDFWKIKKPRLVEEIEALKDKVDGTTWGAIDSVRRVGNIGAHMEQDVNLIIDVEPEEAGLLIWLIETLLTEWYVGRHDREERMKAVVNLASAKAVVKKPPPATKPPS